MSMPSGPSNPEFAGRPPENPERIVLDEEQEALVDFLSDYYRSNPGTVLAQEGNELSEPIAQWIGRLYQVFRDRDDESEVELRDAIYAVVHFALNVASLQSKGDEDIRPSLLELESRLEEQGADKERQIIEQLAQEYTVRHPSEIGIFRAFVDEIDRTGKHGEKVETIYAFVRDAIERRPWEEGLFAELQSELESAALVPDMDHEFSLMMVESDIVTDLDPVRKRLLWWKDALLPMIYDAFETSVGRPVDITNPDDVREVARVLREELLDNWKNLEGVPMDGDTIVLSGKGIVMPFYAEADGEEEGYSGLVLGEKTQVRGTFRTIDVQPYIDAAVLDVDDEDQEAASHDYERPFGLQFVLEDVVIIDGDPDDEVGTPTHYNVPLEYPEMKIGIISMAEDPQDE